MIFEFLLPNSLFPTPDFDPNSAFVYNNSKQGILYAGNYSDVY